MLLYGGDHKNKGVDMCRALSLAMFCFWLCNAAQAADTSDTPSPNKIESNSSTNKPFTATYLKTVQAKTVGSEISPTDTATQPIKKPATEEAALTPTTPAALKTPKNGKGSIIPTDSDGQFYVQIASCYLEKCISEYLNQAQKNQWPLSVRRASTSNRVYEVSSSFALRRSTAERLKQQLQTIDKAKPNIQRTESGFFVSLGTFDDVVDAYQAQMQADEIGKRYNIVFRMSQRQARDDATRILVGPYSTIEKARKQKWYIRRNTPFTAAFIFIDQ